MNKFPPIRRRWSFVRPVHSTAFLAAEAFGVVCLIGVLAFLPFRYSVKVPAAAPFRSDGIFQLGQTASSRSTEILDMRDPAGVLNTQGRAGYFSCLPPQSKELFTFEESLQLPFAAVPQVAFHPLKERPVQPVWVSLQPQTVKAAPLPSGGVMVTEEGRRLGEIALPPETALWGGVTVIRLAGGSEFFRSELLRSCGNAALDKLALKKSRKLGRIDSRILLVFWPQRNKGAKVK